MRVALVSHSAELGGAERSMISLLGALTRRGHAVEVVLPGRGPLVDAVLDGSSTTTVRTCSIHRWLSPRGRGPAGVVRLVQCLVEVPGVVRALRRCRPDLVVVNSSASPAPMLAGRLLRLPTVVLVREAVCSNPVMASALPKRVLVAAMKTWATRLVAVSEFTGGQVGADDVVLEHVLPPPHVRHVPGSGALRAALIGAVTQDKGQVEAVAATASAISGGAEVRLDLYGGGAERDITALRHAIVGTGMTDRIQYHGETSSVPDVLARTDVLLVCSRHEGFGRVTVEALQAGVPVVGFDAGGTAEILRRGGGVLVPPEVGAMTEALVALASDAELLTAQRDAAATAGAWWSSRRGDEELVGLLEEVACASATPLTSRCAP